MILGMFLFFNILSAKTIHVAIASNMSYVIKELTQQFQAEHPHTKVIVSLGSSGKMTAQIKHGAPYQIFMSADMRFPQRLYDEGSAVTKPAIYAQGSLAIFSSKKQNFTKGLYIVEDTNLDTIVIANPKTAPYGKATMEALKNAGIYDKITSKLVYGESIAQTTSYAVHIVDIGFVAKSSLFNPKMLRYKEGIHWIEVNPKFYTPIDQGIVILKNGKNNKDVQAFYDFIFRPKAQNILENFGYKIP